MRDRPRWSSLVVVALAAGTAGVAGCQSAMDSAYYGVMESVGREKRHILRDRVESGQEEQREAQEQFQTAYQRFKEVSGYSGGDLEGVYDDLAGELESSEQRAAAVSERIESIEGVAADLFDEWTAEAAEIQSASLRRSSEQQLRDTKRRYATLIAAMRRAESKMAPVLSAFRDQVLYLKHNLNARAIASLEGNVREIEGDVEALIRDIGASIREAETFLASME
jgi:hypothetical protein